MQDLSNSIRKNWGASLVALAVMTASCSSETAAPVVTVNGESVEVPITCRGPLSDYLVQVLAAFEEFDSSLVPYQTAVEELESAGITTGEDFASAELSLEGATLGFRANRILNLEEAGDQVPAVCFPNRRPSSYSDLSKFEVDQGVIEVVLSHPVVETSIVVPGP